MEKRCYGCMRPMGAQSHCEYCGYPQNGKNADHQLSVGTVLRGQYLVGKVLGQGGFGITYSGWDMELKVAVAIKEFFPASQINRTQDTMVTAIDEPGFQEGRKQFLKEAQTLARLRKLPNIVQVHDYFSENNTAYIVMEYVQGITLLEHIRQRGGTLSPQETFSLLRPILQSMARVHESGMVHRDISPDNIMVQSDGTVKILDFGTARDVEAGQLTHSTQAVLKNGFAPAEQYISGRTIDRRVDEYALCVTIYYCLTGKVPAGALERSVEKTEIPWNQIPGLTENQKLALRQGTALKPDDRFPDLKALEDALYGGSIRKKKAVRPWLAAAAALVLTAFAGLAIWRAGMTGEVQEIPITETTAPAQTQSQIQPLAIKPQTISAGNDYTLGVNPDGTVVVAEAYTSYGRSRVEDWSGIVAVSTGIAMSAGLRADGTAVATVGLNEYIHHSVSYWENIVSISVGLVDDVIGVKADGTVETPFPSDDASDWTVISAVSSGLLHTAGLKFDGTVVAAGENEDGQCYVSDWTDIVEISAGYRHTVGLKSDGSVVTVGYLCDGALDTSGWKLRAPGEG